MRLYRMILAAAMTSLPVIAQSTFPALLANGPDPRYRDKLQLFGQFVGSWTFEGREYHDDGSHPADKGEIHCRWVLEGRAIQDVFLETSRGDKDPLLYGTTIRFYDPRTDTWQVTWIDPGAGVVRTFIGRKTGSEIVMEGTAGDGTPIRWIFSNIRPQSFHWRGEKRAGSTWHTYEEFDAHRK
jgi:hypothetical protein